MHQMPERLAPLPHSTVATVEELCSIWSYCPVLYICIPTGQLRLKPKKAAQAPHRKKYFTIIVLTIL